MQRLPLSDLSNQRSSTQVCVPILGMAVVVADEPPHRSSSVKLKAPMVSTCSHTGTPVLAICSSEGAAHPSS